MGADEKVPLEWVLDGNDDQALAAYKELKSAMPDDEAVREGRINNLGYQMMGQGKLNLAIALFKINVALYPNGYNTYDSLGEAYMENGDTELATDNYRKSLELNPDNTHAADMIKKMEEQSSSD